MSLIRKMLTVVFAIVWSGQASGTLTYKDADIIPHTVGDRYICVSHFFYYGTSEDGKTLKSRATEIFEFTITEDLAMNEKHLEFGDYGFFKNSIIPVTGFNDVVIRAHRKDTQSYFVMRHLTFHYASANPLAIHVMKGSCTKP